MKKSLSVRYSIIQFSYWASYSGAAVFVATYLLEKGLSSSMIGILLAASSLLSCVSQPLVAAFADRAKKFILPKLMLLFSALYVACFALQLLPGLSAIWAGLLYLLGLWCSDSMEPLMNALSVAGNNMGYKINFGVARGFGTAASACAALALGHVLTRLGSIWMFAIVIAFRMICMAAVIGFPKLSKENLRNAETNQSCSITTFLSRYRWYCISLIGIGFLGMCDVMIENYMIAIVSPLGGDGRHVGTALFVSSLASTPAIFFYSVFRKRFRDTTLLKIAGFSFLLRAALFCVVPNVQGVYLLELLQMTAFGLLAPGIVYYAGSKVSAEDMVKGQGFGSATYVLGCACGNFAGGQLLNLGVKTMLFTSTMIALAGLLILFATANRTDKQKAQV